MCFIFIPGLKYVVSPAWKKKLVRMDEFRINWIVLLISIFFLEFIVLYGFHCYM